MLSDLKYIVDDIKLYCNKVRYVVGGVIASRTVRYVVGGVIASRTLNK